MIRKIFCLKSLFYVFSQLHFYRFTFKNTPSYSFKYLESSDVIVVKKKSLLKGYLFSLLLYSNLCLKKDKMVVERLDVQIEQRRILI